MPERIRRVPSADWRTENLEELWSNTDPSDSGHFCGSLHYFLEYCYLLRSVRQQFEIDDQKTQYEGYAVFLRGGYFAFKYLNLTSSMARKGTIFGGLNHGRNPALELPRFINELREKALSSERHHVELLIIDEVKSGSGIGRILNLVKETMDAWPASARCDVKIRFYAIRPDSADQMTEELRAATIRWHDTHEMNGGQLVVDVKHFAGPLPGYDSDRFCGVKRTSSSRDQNESYEILKSVGGTVALCCQVTNKIVFEASMNSGSLVEFLSSCAVAWTADVEGAQSKNLAQGIELFGCSRCKELYQRAKGQI